MSKGDDNSSAGKRGMGGRRRLPWSASIPTIILAAVIAMSSLPYHVMDVYAQAGGEVECAGHTIERGDFDADPEDEVKVDGTQYDAGDTITLDGKTYTVMIGSGTINGTTGNDFIVGSDGNDRIYGREGDDFIVGLAGDDRLYGDGIDGTADDDTLTGGNDILCGNDGDDRLYGDYIAGFGGNDTLQGGNDTLDGGGGDDALSGDNIGGLYKFEDVDNFTEELIVDNIDDIIDDKLEDNDTITGGDDILSGNGGNDRLYGDNIVGFGGNDKIQGGNDKLDGGDGDDYLSGDNRRGGYTVALPIIIVDDKLEDNDTITGGDDILSGNGGNDWLDGDVIGGWAGNDTTYGGNDKLDGGDGDDYLSGDGIDGWSGNDKIQGGNDKLDGGDGDDYLSGDWIGGVDEDGDDTITGGDDILSGNGGNDSLYGDNIGGGSGNDTTYGGNDIIDAKDGTNNDSIDGDYLINAENAIPGSEDVCASDPDTDTMVNCEYDDISSLATFNPSQSVINTGESVDLVFTSYVDNNVVITDLKVTTPDGDMCTYNDASNPLPVTVPANGTFTATYPGDFPGCSTNTLGTYTAILTTEVGDPIVTVFTTSFQVVPETIAGVAGIVGSSLAALMLYMRRGSSSSNNSNSSNSSSSSR